MLSRKQLEDAAKCCLDFDCCKCVNTKLCNKPGGATQAATQTAIALADMVRRLEWSLKGKLRKTSPEREYYCPICENNKRIGHASDCELAKLLKESEGEEG